MKKRLGCMIVAIALASPLFAEVTGPGDGDPLPPPASITTVAPASTTSAVLAALLSYLGL